MGLKANADGSGAIQVGGSDAITISAALNTTFAGTAAVPTGTLYPLVAGTAVASTSGTSIEFTNIPSWVKRVTVMFSTVSTNGTGVWQLQLGTGATPTYTITGYLGGTGGATSGGAGQAAATTTGFRVGGNYAANLSWEGAVTLTLLNPTTNLWVASGVLFSDAGTVQIYMNAGTVTLAGVATAVRLIASATGSPSDTFDLGSINILYE
jgi:hypothetical protein